MDRSDGCCATYHVIRHCHEQIKEQLATSFHFRLHCTAVFEGPSAADDQGEIMRAQFRIVIGRVRVGVTGRREDCVTLDARLEPLLAQSKALELWEPILFGCTLKPCQSGYTLVTRKARRT